MLFDLIEDLTEEELMFPSKDNKRQKRRRTDYLKAKRKNRIAKRVYNGGWEAPFGYFRKGKIHCSCPMCSGKTNSSINKSKGPTSEVRIGHISRLAVTNKRYGKKSYKPSDMKKVDKLVSQMEEELCGQLNI